MEHLVLDAGALISGETKTFYKTGCKLWTVPEVISEIRDSKARAQLAALPFEVEVKNPTERALHAVSGFARKTGDFAALSLCDLKVIALTYDLETEHNGTEFIREAPKMLVHSIPKKQKRPVQTTPKPAAACECCAGHSHEIDESFTPASLQTEEEAETEQMTRSLHSDDEESVSESDEGEEGGDDLDMEADSLRTSEPVQEAHVSLPTDHKELDIDIDAASGQVESVGNSVQFDIPGEREQDEPPIDPVHFTSDDFPSLSTVNTSPAVPPAHAVAAAPLSWATITGTPKAPHPAAHMSQSKKPSEVIIGRDVADTMADMRLGETPKSSRPDSDVVSSRILSLGTGGQGYASAASVAKQALEDDGIGWVSPANISDCRATGEGMLHAQARLSSNKDTAAVTPAVASSSSEAATAEAPFQEAKSRRRRRNTKPEVSEPVVRPHAIACITTDYAMQNVMIQMGLQLVSVEGRLIDQVKQWVIRCGACFQIHFDMDRLFCTRCGSDMMQRISASIDSRTGELRLHLKKNYVHNTRGKKYSLPAPGKQGRFSGELLLREDQLLTGIWRQKTVKVRKDVRSAFGEDITSDVGLHINKGSAIKVGLGKRNPNSQKGRERRGKKK